MKPASIISPATLRDRLGTDAPEQLASVGNVALLDEPLLGLISSRVCPGHVLLETLELVPEWVKAGRIIVSGFDSLAGATGTTLHTAPRGRGGESAGARHDKLSFYARRTRNPDQWPDAGHQYLRPHRYAHHTRNCAGTQPPGFRTCHGDVHSLCRRRQPFGFIDRRAGISMTGIGILAYGSLISDPGAEIAPLIVRRIQTTTPFSVEYGRLSGKTRGGAPTVVQHACGRPVKAELLVLSDLVSLDEAKNLLWRRETGKVGSSLVYRENTSPDAVVIRDAPDFCGLGHALYTDFNDSGKILRPNATELAEAAIDSVGKAKLGKDGISYLMNLYKGGVETALTPDYIAQILTQTRCTSLEDALAQVRNSMEGTHNGQS